MRKKNTNQNSAKQLLSTMQQQARDGYVALPVRKLFGERKGKYGKAWNDVFNTLLEVDESEENINTGALSPVCSEMAAQGGTDGLGYMTWGANNNLPNLIATLVSLLPYTAVGVKFNADVVAGLGPKPKYRYSRYVNGIIQEESINYASAGQFIKGLLMEKRYALMELPKAESTFGLDPVLDAKESIRKQLTEDIKSLEKDYEIWKQTLDEVEKLLKNTNLNLLFTELAMDMAHYGICFPEVQLDKQSANKSDELWKPKIIGLNHQRCMTTRLERMNDKNEINYVYVSNQWYDAQVVPAGQNSLIASIPALDAHRPLKSLQQKVRDVRLRAYNGKRNANGKSHGMRPTHFVLPCYYPSPNRPYYPEPAWHSIFRGDIYRYTATIVSDRYIAKRNSNSAGKIIYIHTEYLEKLYQQLDAAKQEDREKLRDEMWDEINTFLQDRQNNGQTILSFTFIGSDAKEHDAWRIVDVPINNKSEADANKTELEELSNIIFLALNIHSVLIGNSIGSSASGGTQQREMYELKKLLSVPTQRLLLTPLYLFRDFNELDPHLEWEVGQMTLTTLDRNKNGMEETKV